MGAEQDLPAPTAFAKGEGADSILNHPGVSRSPNIGDRERRGTRAAVGHGPGFTGKQPGDQALPIHIQGAAVHRHVA